MSKKSAVWNYFKKDDKNPGEAKCSKCNKSIGWKSSTTPMINHLRLIHDIRTNLTCQPNDEDIQSTIIGSPIPSTSKKSKLECNSVLNFLKKESLNEILARIAAVDGMSIKAIAKSRAIIGYVTQRGYKMPKSPTTISNRINKFYETKRDQLREVFKKLKQANRKFSITVDEWTDCTFLRYLNVTAHVLGMNEITVECNVLGLIEILKQANAEEIQRLVDVKLTDFGLVLNKDVISSTHDAAAVMKKYGNLIGTINKLCYNHAIHLAVMDCFYKLKSDITDSDENGIKADASDSDESRSLDDNIECSDDENENESQYEDNIEELLEQNPHILMNTHFGTTIKKLRNTTKLFKVSLTKQTVLQEYVNLQMGKKIKLKLDVKTRWNSLCTMIRRFQLLAESVNKALNDLNLETFAEQEIILLQEALDILTPVETAVLELSKNDASLITAEGVFKFLFEKLEEINSDFSKKFLSTIKTRMNERRDQTLMTLIIYLQSGNLPRSNVNFKYSPKNAIVNYAVEIMERIHPQMFSQEQECSMADNNDNDMGIDVEEIEPRTPQAILQKQLQNAIASIVNSPSNERIANIDKSNQIKKEFRHLEAFKKRSESLDILYYALLTVRPTSTASERVFSTAGSIKTKIRSSLNFKTFNSIIFLKYDFNKMN